MIAFALAPLERHSAFSAAVTAAPRIDSGDHAFAEGVHAPAVLSDVETYLITVGPGNHVLQAGDLALSALLSAFTDWGTTTPKAFVLHLLTSRSSSAVRSVAGRPTLAQSAIQDIKALSGLTNEHIAPLAGVSRRSLQAWMAGERISQRNERHLLDLRKALRALSAGDPVATRRRLLDQAPGSVRVYDLLAAGRFDTAVDVAIGRRHLPAPRSRGPESESLVTQLNRLEDSVPILEAPSTGRFSGRLRR